LWCRGSYRRRRGPDGDYICAEIKMLFNSLESTGNRQQRRKAILTNITYHRRTDSSRQPLFSRMLSSPTKSIYCLNFLVARGKMKFLFYTFLLFSLASLGLAKGLKCCYADGLNPCSETCSCCETKGGGRTLKTVRGLFVRDTEQMDFTKMKS
jgi:hypothetical protein